MSLRYIILILCIAVSVSAAEGNAKKPSGRDKCPVCGMFVSKYPDFLAQIDLEEGTSLFFDGPKDMFKFYQDIRRYLPAKAERKIKEIFVTDYYEVKAIDAKNAWYVIGSDILGPMGRELIPFRTEKDALEFMKDHHGRRIVRFNEVTPALINELDKNP